MHENKDAKIKAHNIYMLDHLPMSEGSTTKQTESVNQGTLRLSLGLKSSKT